MWRAERTYLGGCGRGEQRPCDVFDDAECISTSQEILTGVIPALLTEGEAVRRRAEAAEERSQRLSRENDDLQGEITKLSGDVNALTRQRAEIADAVAEIRRLTDEAMLKLSGQ